MACNSSERNKLSTVRELIGSGVEKQHVL